MKKKYNIFPEGEIQYFSWWKNTIFSWKKKKVFLWWRNSSFYL